MEIDRAAESLDRELRAHYWYVSTGVGRDDNGEALFVYVKSRRDPKIRNLSKWMGYPVVVRTVGSFRPVSELCEA